MDVRKKVRTGGGVFLAFSGGTCWINGFTIEFVLAGWFSSLPPPPSLAVNFYAISCGGYKLALENESSPPLTPVFVGLWSRVDGRIRGSLPPPDDYFLPDGPGGSNLASGQPLLSNTKLVSVVD